MQYLSEKSRKAIISQVAETSCVVCLFPLVEIKLKYKEIMDESTNAKDKITKIENLLLHYPKCCRSNLKYAYGYPNMPEGR